MSHDDANKRIRREWEEHCELKTVFSSSKVEVDFRHSDYTWGATERGEPGFEFYIKRLEVEFPGAMASCERKRPLPN